MKNPLAAMILTAAAVLAPNFSNCAPATAAENLAVARASRAAKNPAAQIPAIFNREFVAQDAKRIARKFANSRYVQVRGVLQEEIPRSVHTVIVNQEISNARVYYFTNEPNK
jgi:hypothetical protein